jgi:hypothetical protein
MLVIIIPFALDHGVILLVETRVEKMVIDGGCVIVIQCIVVKSNAVFGEYKENIIL